MPNIPDAALGEPSEPPRPGRLRLFFFSDWRLQPLELAEAMLAAAQPVDLILYGGDDICRFGDRPPLEEGTWLDRIARQARFGLGAIVGNDCAPGDRDLLQRPGARDLHAAPALVAGWGFVGIEGAIYQGSTNNPGLGVFPEREVRQHLERAVAQLRLPPRRLVIVSHTPPAGCRLDLAIRFGFDRLGSPALTDFIRMHEPALVLCGHCHCRGGKSAWLGKTLVVNGASDDRKVRQARAALIELVLDQPPAVTWLDPTPHSVVFVPEIGPVRAEKLARAGIIRPAQLYAADAEALKSIGFGALRQRRLQAYHQAIATNQPVWLAQPRESLPAELLFYDVETGLTLTEEDGPWMIAALTPGAERVAQWCAPEADRQARRAMLRQFLDVVRSYPDAKLCSWSGTQFDERAVRAGLERWWPRGVKEWDRLPQLDLLRFLKPLVVLPTPDWSLKSVAPWCGYAGHGGGESTLDSFEVGLRYEEFRWGGTELPVDAIARFDAIARYNADDVLALAHIATWMREHLAPNGQ